MKEGWIYKKLGEVCEVISGQSPEGKNYNKDGDGLPFYQGKKDFSLKYVGDPTMWSTEVTKLAEKDDILMSVRAPVGDINFATQKICIGRGLAAIRVGEHIDKDFLFFYLLANKNDIKGKEGVGFSSINRKEIMDIGIYYPNNVMEQQRIAKRLDVAISHIDELKANAEKQLSEARALFQKSLAKAMEPKEGWGERKFKDLCSFVRGPFGGSLKKEMFVASGYAVYEQQNAIYNRFSFRYFIDEEKYNSMIRFSVSPGDLIMSCSGTIGKVAIIPDDAVNGIINQALLKLTPKKILDKYYLKYLMESSFFGQLITQYSDGAAIKNIASVAILKDIILPLPSLSEQQRIVERLDALSAHVRELEENQKKIISECDALKQALLRKVFE